MLGRLKQAVAGASRKSRRVIRRLNSISVNAIDECLNRLEVKGLDALMVHSSLSGCGYIPGGPNTVIEQLIQRSQLLCLPTHTYCYPKPDADAQVYDRTSSRSQVGAISDYFWRCDNVVRSIHPSHSLAASGSNAPDLCSNHERCDSPCGESTPYESLINMSASVLMFGCTMNTYTLFHTTEALAGCDYLYCVDPVTMTYIDADGVQQSMQMKRQDMSVSRRFTEMEDELVDSELLRRTSLGRGTLLFIPNAGDVHQYLMDRLTQNPRYLVAEV